MEDESLPPAEVAVHNALLKARAVARIHPHRIVLGADTVVALSGRLFGKPRDLVHAREMLQALSGHSHQVITGVAIIAPEGTASFSETTEVTFHSLTPERISDYLSRVDVLDKAGAYAIQEHGDLIVKAIRGSFSNVVGLPQEKVRSALHEFGCLSAG